MKDASGLRNQEDLFLGKIKMDKTQSLEKSSKQRRLDVQSNHLMSVENTSSQACLMIK